MQQTSVQVLAHLRPPVPVTYGDSSGSKIRCRRMGLNSPVSKLMGTRQVYDATSPFCSRCYHSSKCAPATVSSN